MWPRRRKEVAKGSKCLLTEGNAAEVCRLLAIKITAFPYHVFPTRYFRSVRGVNGGIDRLRLVIKSEDDEASCLLDPSLSSHTYIPPPFRSCAGDSAPALCRASRSG